MKKGDIVWLFIDGHELRYGEVIRNIGGKYTIRDSKTKRLYRRKTSQLALKEEKCKKSKE